MLFVIFLMTILYSIYTFVHCRWLVQSDESARRGYVEAAVFHVLTFMVLVCYVRSIVTSPGTIPDDDEWALREETTGPVGVIETKKTGDRRRCKWCAKYKPDRCHHCRVCRTCILKMDHHCPWICNCVGFCNHKYFFLLVMYAGMDCHFITWTMLESVRHAMELEGTEFSKMFLLFFGSTLAFFLAVLLTCFLAFHIWLAAGARTTIEFCEQQFKSGSSSTWDNGLWENFRATLGPHFLLWLLPLSPPEGDGLMWHAKETTRLTNDLEEGKRRKGVKGHKPVQRGTESPTDSPPEATTPSGPTPRTAAHCSLTGLLSRGESNSVSPPRRRPPAC